MRVDKGGKGGTIINIISPAALTIQSPTFSVYGATKSAVLQFTTCIGVSLSIFFKLYLAIVKYKAVVAQG